MNCRETQTLLPGYLDGELDLMSSVTLEEHLEKCPACRQEYLHQKAIKGAIQANVKRHQAPAALRQNIQRMLDDIDSVRIPKWKTYWKAAIVAPAIAAAVVVSWMATPRLGEEVRETIDPREKVVYHVNNSQDASSALRNVMNHLEASPDAKVVVVAHNNGVDFLLQGARDPQGHLYESEVSGLVSRGVDFRVCKNTLVRRKVSLDLVIPEARLVPSGIAEITRLQTREGYAYLKP